MPHRRPALGRACLVVLGAVLVPVVLFFGVQALLGVERVAVSSHALAGKADRGTLLFSTQAAVGRLRIGDVITFRPPAPYGDEGRVTREVEARSVLGVRTGTDDGIDPWRLSTAGPDVERAMARVAYLGYPFLGSVPLVERIVWVAVPLAILAASALLVAQRRGRRHRSRRAVPTRS